MGDIILGFIIIIPLYGVLIWSYFYPKESLLWGKRWMYQEEPEISDGAIRYIKFASLISVIGMSLVFIILILTQNLEPWGSGFYINSIGLEVVDEYTKTKITLNLGDEIRCVSETIETGYS